MPSEKKNDCALLTGEKGEEHSLQYEARKLSKWIHFTLIALFSIVTLTAACFLIVVYVKMDHLEELYNDLVNDKIHNELTNGISRKQMINATKENIFEEEEKSLGIASDFENVSKIDNLTLYNKQSQNKDKVITLHGIQPHVTYSIGNKEAARIRNWKVVDDHTNENSYFTLINQSAITIGKSGLYAIRAQLCWRKRGGLASFRVSNSENNLTQCISAFPEEYATLKTCFTAITKYLQKGDIISVVIDSAVLTIDFTDRKSFLQLDILGFVDS